MQFKTEVTHHLNLSEHADVLRLVNVHRSPATIQRNFGLYINDGNDEGVCSSFSMSKGSVDDLVVGEMTTATYSGGVLRNVSVQPDGHLYITMYGQPIIDEIHVKSHGVLHITYKQTLEQLVDVCKFYFDVGSQLLVESTIYPIEEETDIYKLVRNIIHTKEK